MLNYPFGRFASFPFLVIWYGICALTNKGCVTDLYRTGDEPWKEMRSRNELRVIGKCELCQCGNLNFFFGFNWDVWGVVLGLIGRIVLENEGGFQLYEIYVKDNAKNNYNKGIGILF